MSDFDKYIRQGEPGQAEKARIWQTAIGLQDVDGLKTSEYLKETAQKHIEGDLSIEDVRDLLDSYYESNTFSPDYFISIHRRLFAGIYQFAGQIRDYNTSKKEWVLDGASVLYSDSYMIRRTLDYDFARERAFSYAGLSPADAVKHIAGFISGIWQIHAFGEGNTRTTAVFAIKYLRSFGFDITDQYLVRFFRNLFFGENNTLSNREMHVSVQSISPDVSKSQIDTLNCSLEELAVLKAVGENPRITQEALRKTLGKSISTVKRLTVNLQKKGILVRKNGKRDGYWEILI